MPAWQPQSGSRSRFCLRRARRRRWRSPRCAAGALWRTFRAFSTATASRARRRDADGRRAAEEHAASLTANARAPGRGRASDLQASLAELAVLRAAAARPARSSPPARRGAAQVTRVAAIDLGTNATRLLVADVEDGRVDEIVRRTRITRLGEGVDARRRLLPLPIARVRNVLIDYRRELEELGAERTLAVATSAVRDAENGEAFLGEIEWSYGFATRLLTGDEEAAMTLRGVGPLEPGHRRDRRRRRLDRADHRELPHEPRHRLACG